MRDHWLTNKGFHIGDTAAKIHASSIKFAPGSVLWCRFFLVQYRPIIVSSSKTNVKTLIKKTMFDTCIKLFETCIKISWHKRQSPCRKPNVKRTWCPHQEILTHASKSCRSVTNVKTLIPLTVGGQSGEGITVSPGPEGPPAARPDVTETEMRGVWDPMMYPVRTLRWSKSGGGGHRWRSFVSSIDKTKPAVTPSDTQTKDRVPEPWCWMSRQKQRVVLFVLNLNFKNVCIKIVETDIFLVWRSGQEKWTLSSGAHPNAPTKFIC